MPPATQYDFADMFPAPEPEISPTSEQYAIMRSLESPLKVIAFAGTGKTSCLEMRARAFPNQSILYLAFNRSMGDEAKKRFPSNATALTVHSLAFRHTGRNYNLGRLSAYQISRRCECSFYIGLLISKTIENWCNSADPLITTEHVAKDFLLRLEAGKSGAGDKLVYWANKIWDEMKQGNNRSIPMTHSGYLKLFQLQRPSLGYESIYLDEAQDTNMVTHDLVMSQADFGSKVVLVGDAFQAIYSWRGAINALQRINAATLYLTRSFRFGAPIADVANTLLGTYHPGVHQIIGSGHSRVGWVDRDQPHTYISRTNSFLFKKAVELAQRTRVYIAGSTPDGEIPIFQTLLDFYHLWKKEKDKIKDPEVRCFDDFEQAMTLSEDGCLDHEYLVAVRIVTEYTVDIPVKIAEIKKALVFDPQEAHVILTTTHKAKGLEFQRVIIADDFPSLYSKGNLIPMGIGENEISPEEINLLYVAATRAREELQLNTDLQKLVQQRSFSPFLESPNEPGE